MDESNLMRIASYLEGKMTPEERLSFEKLVSENPELEKELMLSKKIHYHFENPYQEKNIQETKYAQKLRQELANDDTKKIKETIQQIGLEYTKEQEASKSPFRTWMFAAAAVLVLVFAINFFLDASSGDLYATYYNEQDVPSVIQRDGEKTLLSQGVTAFHASDYETAINLFETYEAENAIAITGFYILKGIAYSNVGDVENAIKNLDISITSQSLDSSKGVWFKALVYLKVDEIEKAKSTLLDIGENDFNYAKAQELLKEL